MVFDLVPFALKSGSEGAHGMKNAHNFLNMVGGVTAFALAFNKGIGNSWVYLGKPGMVRV